MASRQNSASKAFASPYGLTSAQVGLLRGSGKTNVQQTMYQQMLDAYYLNPEGYEKMAFNATYRFEVTKDGPVLTEAPLEELEKAWCLYKTLYTQQKAKSKNRGYQPPAYTEKELLDWMDAQPTFQSLYDSWVAFGYSSNLRPSVDRISDTTSYTMSNIQLMTWEENNKKAYESYLTGDTTKKCAAVDMLDLEGNFMKRFISVSEAAREFNGIPGNITSAILQRVSKRSNGTTYTTLTAYGHKWWYSTIPNDNSEVI